MSDMAWEGVPRAAAAAAWAVPEPDQPVEIGQLAAEKARAVRGVDQTAASARPSATSPAT